MAGRGGRGKNLLRKYQFGIPVRRSRSRALLFPPCNNQHSITGRAVQLGAASVAAFTDTVAELVGKLVGKPGAVAVGIQQQLVE